MRRTLTSSEASASGEVFGSRQWEVTCLHHRRRHHSVSLELSTQSLNPRSWSPALFLSEPDF